MHHPLQQRRIGGGHALTQLLDQRADPAGEDHAVDGIDQHGFRRPAIHMPCP
ncbi:hypothetical protein D3C76_570280 [compost metagenome]